MKFAFDVGYIYLKYLTNMTGSYLIFWDIVGHCLVLSTNGAFLTHVGNIIIPVLPIYQCAGQQFQFNYPHMDIMDSPQKFIRNPNWYYNSNLKKYDAIDYV